MKDKEQSVWFTLFPRTKRFLEASRERVTEEIEKTKVVNWTYAFFELYRTESLRKRQALSLAYALVKEPVRLFDDEWLIGQLYTQPSCDLGGAQFDARWKEYDCAFTAEERIRTELPEILSLAGEEKDGKNRKWISHVGCAPGHIGWHWEWILRDGVEGLLRRIEASSAGADKAGNEFLDGCRIALKALLEWNDLHVQALEMKIAETADPHIKKRLREKVEVCRRVPRHGARSFLESVQSFHISYLATLFENPYGGNGPGRLDYHLWPYLEKDLAEGKETLSSAREKIDELFIRFHERNFHRDMGVETIVTAGCHPDGTSAYNPLSRMMVEAICALKITCPSVYIRVPENPPGELIDLAALYIRQGANLAQILNDKTIVQAMTRDSGMSIADARMYMCGGCMEISPQGMNGDLLFTGFFNTPKILELVLTGGVCLNTGDKIMPHLTKTLADYATFDALYHDFSLELQRTLLLTFKRMDIHSEEFARLRPGFLISSQIDDCLTRGRGINAGGARYEDYGATPLGLPNAGDGLTAIKSSVFDDEAFVSGAELLDALQNNFRGKEELRLKLLNLPKFGQGVKAADAMVNRVLNTTCDIFDSYRNRLGGRVKPMMMSFVFAPIAGNALGATPDGHVAGTPVAQGLTPQSGSMCKGITTAMLSANAIDLHRVSGGSTSMWDLDHNFATQDIVSSLILGFIKSGGQIYQGNTSDVDVLREAQRHPEKHHDVIVRVGGFSAKFLGLSKELQNEIIARYRHAR